MNTRQTEQKALEYIRKYEMIKPADRVLAAVSGGADSVCLLVILNRLRDELGAEIGAFHLNHGIRGAEADRDEEYVRELCEKFGIPCIIMHEDVPAYAAEHGLSEEEAGRILRYRDLSEAAGRDGYGRIATAHQRNDDAETVLMNLFRGSGLAGLAGIPPVRDRVIRPLLCFSGSEIREYLTQLGIAWCEDSTNAGDRYLRNRIRNGLIPWVEQNVNANATDHILTMSSFAAGADAYFRELAVRIVSGNSEDGRMPTDVFDAQSDIVKGYIVREMISRTGAPQKDIGENHINAVMSLTGPGGSVHADLPHGLIATRDYDTISVGYAKDEPYFPDIVPEIRVFPMKKYAQIPKSTYTKWFDYDKIEHTPVFRKRKEGDYIELAGVGRKTLHRFFIDSKIPEDERDAVPLLADGDHIMWIVGYRISEYYKITEDTGTVMEVKVDFP